MAGSHLRNARRRIDRRLVIVVIVALVVGLVIGACVTWFLSDDVEASGGGGQRAVHPPSTAIVWPVM